MSDAASPQSCGSCGIASCAFHAERKLSAIASDRTGWLLDEYFPEFDLTRLHNVSIHDLFFVPWHRAFFGKTQYNWKLPTNLFIKTHPFMMLRRSLAMRKLNSGAKRQAVLEKYDRHFADAYAGQLPFNVTRLVVWQNFVPFLQLNKGLGGRQYDILAWRPPRHILHNLLDRAKTRWPESATLDDFRSHPSIVKAEKVAFENAAKIITPNAELAKLYSEKAVLLPWTWPHSKHTPRGNRIVFLGPTIGRRGAYLVRDALKELGLPLTVIGKNLEDNNFWQNLNVSYLSTDSNWLDETSILLAPAVADFKPRMIMQALSRNVPTVVSQWCGLQSHPSMHHIDIFDHVALADKIRELIFIN